MSATAIEFNAINRSIREMALQKALVHLACAKAHLKVAGFEGVSKSGRIDIAVRSVTRATSYLKSGMTTAGVPLTRPEEGR